MRPVLLAAILLVACAPAEPAPDAGRTYGPPSTDTFGGDRPVKLRVPSTYDPARSWPLVVLLHGYGVSGLIQATYFGFDALVEEQDVLVAAPDGTADAEGLPFWNASPCCVEGGPQVDDVAYLAGLVGEISAEYHVDPKRVYAVGHSNGAFMAYRLACDHPELFAAIVSLAGADTGTDADCTPAVPVSVLEIHGDADGTVLYEGQPEPGSLIPYPYPGSAESVERWATRDGCTGTLEATGERVSVDDVLAGDETRVARFGGCPAGVGVELWTIEGGSHLPGLGPPFRELVWPWLRAHARR